MRYLLALVVVILVGAPAPAFPHDDGRFTGSPLHDWFNGLASKKGSCCSFADGVSVTDVDWDNDHGRYRVRLCARAPMAGETWQTCGVKAWFDVPNDALITEPNKLGPAVVWPYADSAHTPQIKCFMAGAGDLKR